jgi:hypothetical protein
MALLRKPSYRMALLKYINMSKKKKPKMKDNLSTIMSQGAEEDNPSEIAFKTKRQTLRHIDENSHTGEQEEILPTINELIDFKPLIAGKRLLTRRQIARRDARRHAIA